MKLIRFGAPGHERLGLEGLGSSRQRAVSAA